MENLVTVINPDDKKTIQINANDLSSALKDGATFIPQIPPQDLDGQGNVFVIDPETKKTISVSLDKLPGALTDGGRVASSYDPNKIQTFKSMITDKGLDSLQPYTSLDKVQDEQGRYLVKDHQGNVYHLSQDQALKLVGTNHLQFADSDFQAMVDAQKEMRPSTLKTVAAEFRGVAKGVPVVGSLTDKLSSYLTETTPFLPGKSQDIASEMNRGNSLTDEGRAQNIGQGIGTAASIAGMLSPAGIMGEGLLATKATALLGDSKLLAGAASGLSYSLPYVADQMINNKPQQAAETALLSIGLGALLHAAPSAINSVIDRQARLAASELPEAANAIIKEKGIDPQLINNDKISFVKDLIKVSPKLENVEDAIKHVATGEHLQSTFLKMNEKISNNSLIRQLGELGYSTGKSEAVNNELSKIIHSIEDVSLNQEISLSALQKANKNLISSIDYHGPANELTNLKISALDVINNNLMRAGDNSLAKMIELGDSKAIKLTDAWESGKQSAQTAMGLLGEQVGKASAEPELSLMGKLVKNVASNLGASTINKLSHPITSFLSLPVIGAASGARAQSAENLLTHISSRSAVFDKFLAEHPNGWLMKNVSNPKIGTFVALDAIASNNAKIAEIPNFLKNLASKAPGFIASQQDPITHLLGSEANGLSKQQQLDKLSDKVSLLAGNPDMANARVNDLTQPFAADHPQMASAAQNLAQNKINYLNFIMHGQIPKTEPMAFQANDNPRWTASEIKDIKDKLEAVNNPYVILQGLRTGFVNTKQVEAVQATSPNVLQEIRQTINKEAFNGTTNLTYQQRLKASIIMETSLDPTLNGVQQFQSTFAPPQPVMPTSGNSKKTGHKLNDNKLPSNQTTAQRISGK